MLKKLVPLQVKKRNPFNRSFCVIHITEISSYYIEQPDYPIIPKEIQVPEGNKFKFLLYAFGLQVLACNTTVPESPEWSFVIPKDVTLINDITKHEMFVDEFKVAEN